ncbi:MAG: ABC transporter permease [Oscillospiraceae bacterium]|nr:ABC transporter permease [Oscillospiraceae bacterium]
MLKYIIRRLFLGLFTVFAVTTITFFLLFLVPGGPFLAEKAPSEEVIAELNARYGLDKPRVVQYKNYMVNLLKGDFGVSLKRREYTVKEIIMSGFVVSARLGVLAILIAVIFGMIGGVLAAYYHGKFLDNLLVLFSTWGVAVPSFITTIVFLLFFCVKLSIFPIMGLFSPLHYVLPVTCLAFYPTAYIMRLVRISMLDVLGQDYIRTARAKGLSTFKIIFKHALRNALLPVITYLGPTLAWILIGNFVIEKVFNIPGIGMALISATLGRDYPLIMGITIFLAFIIVLMNILVDILYKIIDPRIRLV